MSEQELKLKVAEAVQDDVNKGVVRIDSTMMKEIGVSPGDIVEIECKRKTVAVADRSYPGDLGLNIIRMDGITRRNAKTSIGEVVIVRKADVKEAKKVTIAPARKGVIVKASSDIFKQGLLRRAAVKGDLVSLGGARRRRTAMTGNPFFEDALFSALDDVGFGFGFGDLKFVVVNTNPPKTSVIITAETEVEFNPEAVEVKEEAATIEVSYEDIGGLQEEVKKIREMVELPLKHPEIFERLGIEPPKGVLLHGPPGTGKTMLAKAVASETNSNFLLINGPEIMSKYYGQSEENLRKKFEDAEKNAPSIIFIDEIDAIASKREETRGEVERRVVAQLLSLMDGLQSRGKVIVLAATNRPNALDPALRRPGRFDRELEIGVPSVDGRMDILKIHTRNMPIKGSFDDEIASKKLIEKIGQMLRESEEEFTTKNQELSKKIIEIEILLNDVKSLEDEIKELQIEQKKNSKDENLIRRIINKLGIAHSSLKSKEKEKSEKEIEIEGIKEFIKPIKRKIDNIRETTVFLEDKRKNLREVINVIKDIEEAREVWTHKDVDARNKFHEIVKKGISEQVKKHTSELIEYGVVSPQFYNEVEQEVWVKRDLPHVAAITHGFVGADLSSLSKEAAMVLLRRVLPDLKLNQEEPIPKEVLEKMYVTMENFKEALKIVRPSAMREVLVEIPNITWNDIGGLEDVKRELIEAVEWPLKHPKAFIRMGIRPPRGILVYGAPGTGKTLLAKAVAHESEANFILVNGPALLSKWVGESERAVREIFRKARQTAPTIIFFDEVDSLAPRRGMNGDNHSNEKVVNQILTEMDGLQELQDVVVIAATNRPDMVDTALLRPGRFDRIILTPVPNEETRYKILSIHAKGMPLDKDVSIKDIAEKAKGYVGADLEAVCREAAMLALRENMDAKIVKKEHFDAALEKVRPSVTESIEELYQEMEGYFKQARAKEMESQKPFYLG